MNNSKIAIENVSLTDEEAFDRKPLLRQRETELTAIIEALEAISGSEYWAVLENMLFIPERNKLQRQLGKENNPTVMYRLQGKLEQANKSIADQIQVHRFELQKVRKQLDGKAD